MNRIFKLLASGTLAAATVVGSGSASFAQEIKVGIISLLSGPYAFNGKVLNDGLKLAFEQANTARAANGEKKIQIIEADTAGDKGQALTQITKMVEIDRVNLIIGPVTSAEALALAPVANQLKVTMFTPGAAAAIVSSGPYAFKITPNAKELMVTLSDYAVKKVGVKKVAIVFDRSSEAFIDQANSFKKGLTDLGVKIVSEDGVLATDTNFVSLQSRLASQDIDGLFVALPTEVGANFVLQVRRAGLDPKVKVFSVQSAVADSFIKTAGGAAEGVYFMADYILSEDSDTNRAFVKAYTEKYGSSPTNWSAIGYAMGTIATTAIKNAGPSPSREQVKEAFANLKDVPIIIGGHSWSPGADRNPIYRGLVLVVKDAKFTVAP